MFRPTYFLMKSFIKNAEYPYCINCIHFSNRLSEYPYTRIMNDINGHCKKYGEANLITGLIKYDYAVNCRKDDEKCGEEGVEYESAIDCKNDDDEKMGIKELEYERK